MVPEPRDGRNCSTRPWTGQLFLAHSPPGAKASVPPSIEDMERLIEAKSKLMMFVGTRYPKSEDGTLPRCPAYSGHFPRGYIFFLETLHGWLLEAVIFLPLPFPPPPWYPYLVACY